MNHLEIAFIIAAAGMLLEEDDGTITAEQQLRFSQWASKLLPTLKAEKMNSITGNELFEYLLQKAGA